MADRYWVGGTGSWDASSTANWSATSGGAAGASAPTIADQAIFNASSGTGTVTIFTGATCLTLTASAITANTVFAIDVFGGEVVLSTNATFGASATGLLNLNFQGTVATSVLNCASATVLNDVVNSKTSGTLSIATNNCTCQGNFANNSATTTLTTNLTCAGFYLNGGTFNINAATLTSRNLITDNGSSTTRALVFTTGTANLGTTITTTNLDQITWSFNSTGMTLTRGTGKVVIGSTTAQATSASFTGGGLTYYDVLFQGTKTEIVDSNTYTGATTFGFRVTTPAAINHEFILTSGTTQTVNAGTFSIVGNSVTNRAFALSGTLGTAATINVTSTGTRTLTNVDLQDVAFTFGSALTGTSIGNCGGNSGVTTTTAVTCYAKTGATAFNYSGAMWFTTSGGAVTQRVPLPQDTVIFDSNTGSGVVTVNVKTLGNSVTTTGWVGSFAYSGSNPSNTIASIYGQYTGTASLLNNVSALRFAARTNITIPATSPSTALVIDTTGATGTLGGAINNSNLQLYAHSGTFDTASYAITVSTLRPNTSSFSGFSGNFFIGVVNGNAATTTLNASTVTLTAAASAILFNEAGATFNAGTSTINLTPSGSNTVLTFAGGGSTFNTVNLTPNSSMTGLTITGANTFASFTCSTDYPINLTLSSSTTNTFTSLSLTGKKGAGIFVKPSTLATTTTIAIGSDSSTRFTSFRNITKSGASTLTARNVANLGLNTGITFTVKTKVLAYTTGASSFTVPGDFAGSNMFYTIGAGGGAAKRGVNVGSSGGAGSGAIGISSNLNVSKGQTVYYSIGSAGVGATTSSTNGTNGGQTWVNTSANTAPATVGIGSIANGGFGSSQGNGLGGSGGSTSATPNLISIGGAAGGDAASGQGGGGASCVGFNYSTARAGAAGASVTGGGGGGGGGIAAVGGAPVTGASGRGGNGGAGTGSGGAGGADGTTTSTAGGAGGAGAGGGGSGSVSSNGATAGAGGAGGAGSEFTYTSLNGVVSTGTIGAGGGGGGGGGSESSAQTTVTGGAGGAGFYGGGGAGGGRGSTVNGNGGNGGGGLLLFVYEISSGNFGSIIG